MSSLFKVNKFKENKFKNKEISFKTKLNYLEYLKKFFNENRLHKKTQETIDKDFEIQFIYNSNAIERIEFSLEETQSILENFLANENDFKYIETINHKKAYDFMNSIIDGSLTEAHIRQIHYLLLKNIKNQQQYAGIYRNFNVRILGAKHIPPSYIKVPFKMQELLNWYQANTALNPILKAIKLHTEFVSIHPFIDGNGRTARLLLNFELLKNKYIPVIIENSQREQYYDGLEDVNFKNDYLKLNNLVVDNLLNSYETLKKLSLNKNILSLNDFINLKIENN